MTHSAIAHHLMTNAQPLPKQQLLPPSQLTPAYILSMMSYGFGQLESAVLSVSPPSFLCTPCPLTDRPAWEAEKSLTA